MPGSKVVVNHQVMLRGATSHGAVGRSRLLYIANRPGAVALKTDDDLRIERENERMAKLGYVAFRPGSVAEPNAGHALFDAHGVPVRAEIQRELKETESAIITSVVSVRREDAAELGLSTKQDWERLLRSQWPNYVESLGVMAPENVRWVAAYHIGDKSGIPHCHVFTWDASGQFDSLLPKQRMARANDDLRAFLLKPQREELSLVRTQARDELVSSMRNMQLTDGQVRAIAQALPTEGSLKYAKLAKFHPDAVKPVDEAVAEALKSNADMAAVAKRYRAAVVEHGELKGLTGDALQAHIAAADADLRTRLGNAAIANVRNDLNIEPHLQREAVEIDLRTEVPMLPSDRKAVQAIAEELESCLSPSERNSLIAGITQSAKGEALPDESRSVLKKVPSAEHIASQALPMATAGARLLAPAIAQATEDGKSDFGDESASDALHTATRIAAAVLARALSAAPKPSTPAPAMKLKNIPKID